MGSVIFPFPYLRSDLYLVALPSFHIRPQTLLVEIQHLVYGKLVLTRISLDEDEVVRTNLPLHPLQQ